MKKWLISMLFPLSLFAQEVVEDRDVLGEMNQRETGPNTRFSFFGGVRYGLMPDIYESELARIKNTSHMLGWDFYSKLKVNSLFSLVGSYGYAYERYNLRNTQTELLVVSDEIRRRSIQRHVGLVGLALRVNVDPKRGNTMGKYIEAGIEGGLVFARRYKEWRKINTSSQPLGSDFVKLSYRNPSGLNNLTYAAVAKLGYEHIAISARYRLSDLFNHDQQSASLVPAGVDLPRFIFSIEIFYW
ncbi:MAG: hypothetical protein RL226_370 [Bacteroidota bacterium]|jgi:hypothetical protein